MNTINRGIKTINEVLRETSPAVLAALVRRYRNFADAEDALQEVLITAAQRWPVDGIPVNPRGWVYTAACRRMVDAIRSEASRNERETEWGVEQWERWGSVSDPNGQAIASRDDSVALLFMCCHPSLPRHAAVALTLRAVAGLTTGEIASAFLVPEPTMGQRISRAKNRIRESGIELDGPSEAVQEERLRSVRDILYLMFNEGYNRGVTEAGSVPELVYEALSLTRVLQETFPDDGETTGLLALMLLTEARRPARIGHAGEAVPLDRQDRSLWDQTMIREGTQLVAHALSGAPVGPYRIQAAIAAVHAETDRAENTDWPQILALYGLLERISENPVVRLNRAVAMAMVRGPEAGLALIKPLDADKRIAGTHQLHAVRAHLYRIAGDDTSALRHFRAAAERAPSRSERAYLRRQIAEMSNNPH